MEKKYSKCATAIIDDLGYETICSSEGIIGFQNKKTLELSDHISSDQDYECYKLNDGLIIKVNKSGDIIIELPNKATIYIANEKGPYEFIMLTTFNSDSNISSVLSFHYGVNEEKCKIDDIIYVTLGADEEALEQIYTNVEPEQDGKFKWYSFNRIAHDAVDLTSDNIMNLIITRLRKFKPEYLDKNLTIGLETISPAIDIYTDDLKNAWAMNVDNRIKENERQKKAGQKQIEEINAAITAGDNYNLKAKKLQEILSSNSGIHKPKRKTT